eukprot:TRINITY_DN34862_c0_g1_i1.p1 TRINITY_DN34862_c0_g1~~TRINITY_DN34862_c0_g1_i1.p1  ORF type:complete len:106 (+),score=5.73 TRINITY_DN34862_c0_g1_i1:134-451(+)
MLRSLVGSEMCIRDRVWVRVHRGEVRGEFEEMFDGAVDQASHFRLLYWFNQPVHASLIPQVKNVVKPKRGVASTKLYARKDVDWSLLSLNVLTTSAPVRKPTMIH